MQRKSLASVAGPVVDRWMLQAQMLEQAVPGCECFLTKDAFAAALVSIARTAGVPKRDHVSNPSEAGSSPLQEVSHAKTGKLAASCRIVRFS